MRLIVLLTFCITLSMSCRQKEIIPAEIIQPQKMELILWDYLKADAYASEISRKDSTQNDTAINLALQRVIFKHHNTTKQAFDKSYSYYCKHPNKFLPILDSIVASKNKSETSVNNYNRPY